MKPVEIKAEWLKIEDAHDDSQGKHLPLTYAMWVRSALPKATSVMPAISDQIKGCPMGRAPGHGTASARRAVVDLIRRTNDESGTYFVISSTPSPEGHTVAVPTLKAESPVAFSFTPTEYRTMAGALLMEAASLYQHADAIGQEVGQSLRIRASERRDLATRLQTNARTAEGK